MSGMSRSPTLRARRSAWNAGKEHHMPPQIDSFGSRASLRVGDTTVDLYRLDALEKAGVGHVSRLPFSLKILLENLLRYEDGRAVLKEDIAALAAWDPQNPSDREVQFRPPRL